MTTRAWATKSSLLKWIIFYSMFFLMLINANGESDQESVIFFKNLRVGKAKLNGSSKAKKSSKIRFFWFSDL
jgi:hypothetical protein